MPQFSYEGVDQNGTSEQGTIEAGTKDLAFDTLQSRGIIVFDLQQGALGSQANVPWYRRDIQFGSPYLPLRDQAEIAELLATLFDAHLSVPEVLRIVRLSARQTAAKRQFEKVEQRVADGAGFAEAFDAENTLFSPIFVSFLSISDAANARPELLRELSRFFNKQNAVREQVRSALIYPAILCVAALALLTILTFYLAPNLAPIFDSVDKQPPATIQLLLDTNRFLVDFGVFVLIIALGTLLALTAVAQTKIGQKIWSQMLASVPLVGPLISLSALAQLSQACALLLRSGYPLAQALRLAGNTTNTQPAYRARFGEAASALEEGAQAADVFERDQRLPVNFREIFRIGETTNRLPSMLSALSEALYAQVDARSKRALAMLTPAITLVLGLGIGFLIYTLMGALLEVNEVAF